MRKPTEEEKRQLEALLREHEDIVIGLRRRLVFLEGFLAELHGQTAGVPFMVRNEIVWQWFWDSYDCAVTNFASFAKSLLKSGGLFGKLSNHLTQLRPGVHKGLNPSPVVFHDLTGDMTSEDERRIQIELHEGARNQLRDEVARRLERLFPGIKDGQATQEQLVSLKTRFADAVADLQDERHRIAHRYEGDGGERASANLVRLHKGLEEVEEILGDLRLVGLGSQFSFQPTLHATGQLSRDLVDLLLVGSINQIVAEVGLNRPDDELRFYWQFREKQGVRIRGDAPQG